MGRRSIRCAAFLLGIFVATQSAEARDRKAAAKRERGPIFALLTPQEVRPLARRQQASIAAAPKARASSAVRAGTPARWTANRIAQSSKQESAKPDFLHFKVGAFTLKPAVGGVSGAQFSIGF